VDGGGNLTLRESPPSPDSLRKRCPPAEKKNGFSENTVTVKKHYRVRILWGSGDGKDLPSPDPVILNLVLQWKTTLLALRLIQLTT
jgi:hypothetical protein